MAWISLTRRKRARVNASDLAAALAHGSWHAHPSRSRWYAQAAARNGKAGATVSLHRWLWARWGKPPARYVDHRNGDGLDCRRRNLRGANHSQNMANRPAQRNSRTGHRGITLRRSGRYEVSVQKRGRRRYIGTYDTVRAAVRAQRAAARTVHREFAPTIRRHP